MGTVMEHGEAQRPADPERAEDREAQKPKPCACAQQQKQEQEKKKKRKFKHVSFNASGIMSVYHFGVAACLNQFADTSETHYYGASAGALVGASALVGLSPYTSADSMITHCEAVAQDSARIGPLLEETLDALCPQDAHKHCSHRLHISCSKWDLTRLMPAYFSTFETVRQFKDTLLASAHLPFISGVMPQSIEGYDGQYLDGVLTDPHPAPERVAAAREEEPTPAQTPAPGTPVSGLTKQDERRGAFTYPLVSRIRQLTVVESSDTGAESDGTESTVTASSHEDAVEEVHVAVEAHQLKRENEEKEEVNQYAEEEEEQEQIQEQEGVDGMRAVLTQQQHKQGENDARGPPSTETDGNAGTEAMPATTQMHPVQEGEHACKKGGGEGEAAAPSTPIQEDTASRHTAATTTKVALLRKNAQPAARALAAGDDTGDDEAVNGAAPLQSPSHPRTVEQNSTEQEESTVDQEAEDPVQEEEMEVDEGSHHHQQEQRQQWQQQQQPPQTETAHHGSDSKEEEEEDGMMTPVVYDDETLLVAWSPTCSCGCAERGDPRVLTSSVDLHYMWCARPPPLPICRLIFYLGYWNAYCMLHPEEATSAKRRQQAATASTTAAGTAASTAQKDDDAGEGSSADTGAGGGGDAADDKAQEGTCGGRENEDGEREELLHMLMTTPLAEMEVMGPELPAILKKVWPQVESTIQAEHDTFRQLWERNEVWNIAYIWIQARRAELTALGVLSSTVLLSGLAYTLDVSASMGALDALEYMSTSLQSLDVSGLDAMEVWSTVQQQGFEHLGGIDVEQFLRTAFSNNEGFAAFSVLESILDSFREAIFA